MIDLHTLPNRPSKKAKKIKGFFVQLFIILLFTILTGVVYETFSLRHTAKNNPAPGKQIDIAGHSMHLYGQGQGKTTVVFTCDTDALSSYTDFYPVFNEISKVTRAVVYDRPGYGWSSNTSFPRTTEHISDELYALLKKAEEQPPYLLVAHGYGSLEVLRFAQKYPTLVSGVLLIDGVNPDYYLKDSNLPPIQSTSSFYKTELLKRTGILRALGTIGFCKKPKDTRPLPKEIKNIEEMLYYKNHNNKHQREEIENSKKSAKLVHSLKNIGKIPLRILTSEEQNQSHNWKESQENLRAWSTNSKQLIVPNSSHFIHYKNPEIVTQSILDWVK